MIPKGAMVGIIVLNIPRYCQLLTVAFTGLAGDILNSFVYLDFLLSGLMKHVEIWKLSEEGYSRNNEAHFLQKECISVCSCPYN